jgi:thioredoxin-related protein
MKKLPLAIALLIFFSFAFTPDQATEGGIEWETDYAAAVAKAQKEKKALLLNFTGSDWCGWCKRLDREVFSRPEFVAYAEKNLVCVKLDFPRRTKLPQKEVMQNQSLAQKYGVRGFPTIYLLNASQETLLRTGYRPNGPGPYITHLQQAMQKG